MRKTLFFSCAALLALAACGQSQVQSYRLVIDEQTSGRALELVEATQRVAERRLAALGVTTAQITSAPNGTGGGLLTLKLPDQEAADKAQHIFSETFTFELKLEDPSKTDPVTKAAEWKPTGITGADLSWVQAIGDRTTGEVSVELQFTEAGRQKLKDVFSQVKNQTIGIFVRDLLVSKLKLNGAALSDRVIISGIPSARVAEIFAEDVNVGVHVQFVPVQ